ncbi:unnamed protein product [Closterium sp. Naga37s-1]|nr:unnamed protein product [Closterium sp. Naga37s-1]
MDYNTRSIGFGSSGSSSAMGDRDGSDSSRDKDTALGFTGTGSQPVSTRPFENRSKQYQDDPASQQSSPLASPAASSVTSSAPSPFASPSGAEAEGAERKVLERAVVEMALLQEVSRGGIEGSTLEEEWGELRQAVSQNPQLSRLYNEYARDALLAREEQRRQEAGGGRWKVDARGRRIRKRRRGRKAEAEGEEGMSSKARTEERLRRWRAGVVAAATQSTVVEVATMVVLTVLPIAAGAFVYVNVQEWLKAVAPQPAVVEKEPWWMLFGPAASAAGTVFGMAGLGFAAKTAAAAPVAVAVVPQMDALWRSFGGASLVALYWRTLVFGKTFRSIEWDLEAYDAPNGNMKSITIRVPSLNAVRTKIALANGLAGASEVEQLALWIPNSGDFVEPLRLAKDLALIPDFGFVIWSRTPASLHCLPSRAAKTMPSPTAAAGSAGASGGGSSKATAAGAAVGGKAGVWGERNGGSSGWAQQSEAAAVPAAGNGGMQASAQQMVQGQVAANGAVAAAGVARPGMMEDEGEKGWSWEKRGREELERK